MLRLAALIPLALVACVDTGDEGLYIIDNTAVGASCSLSGSPDQARQGHGTIFSGSNKPYIMTPLLQSRLVSSETAGDEIAKTIQLRGADVSLTLKAVTIQNADGTFTSTNPDTMLGQPFSVLFSGAVPPSATTNAFVDIIPVPTLRDLDAMSPVNHFSAEVLATVVVKGDLNGDSIESQPYLYPVTVCSNCIVNEVGPCATLTITPRPGNACNEFQDGVVDCCRQTDGDLVCPAVMEPAPMM